MDFGGLEMTSVASENGKKVLIMAEYIEREALMRRIKEIHCAECDSYHGVRCRACWVDDTLDYIDSEPAADVAPVRHGRWEKQSGLYSCSECGMTCPYDVQADVIEYWACNYCPNCGAKMDGGSI